MAAAAVVVVGVGIGVSRLSADGPHAAAAASSSSPIPVSGKLDAGGQELAALLAHGRAGTSHATYAVTKPAGEPGENLEVWRARTRTREDTVTSGDGRVHTVGIRDGRRQIACRKV